MPLKLPENNGHRYYYLDFETAQIIAPFFLTDGFKNAALGSATIEYRGEKRIVLTQLNKPLILKDLPPSFHPYIVYWFGQIEAYLDAITQSDVARMKKIIDELNLSEENETAGETEK